MLAKSISGAAAAASPAYIEDVFSTYLYTGNNSTNTITNGIDLSGKGGLVWIKSRSAARNNVLVDTARTRSSYLRSNLTNAAAGSPAGADLSTFNSNGFTLESENQGDVNESGVTFASWTFREQAKFFDIVTYTGNGSNRTIAHNLGSVPGCIIVKRTDTTSNWAVYHRSTGNTQYLQLNTTNAAATDATWWNNTTPSATTFTLGTATDVNASGGTYVAYLFAHDAGGFGLTGTDNVISCGSYTTDGSAKATVNLGYEPQWVMLKTSSSTEPWRIFDVMRGWKNSNGQQQLIANATQAENTLGATGPTLTPTSTGFVDNGLIASNQTFIYIAIRRGPMKVPTSGTSVYNAIARTGTGANATVTGVGFAPDFVGIQCRSNSLFEPTFKQWYDRLRGAGKAVPTNASSPEGSYTDTVTSFALMDGVNFGADANGYVNQTMTYINHFLRRAPGFFDVVCDTGTGSAHTITHNLGAVPELMIRKKRSAADAWIVYANNDNTDYLVLNTTAATVDDNTMWNDTSPTSSVFTVGTNDDVNGSGATFVTYLFATVSGVSKVGSYTGSGTTKQIDCGFTGGARFVLIKRTDSTGDWYVWDTARGIVSGNDPYLLLNSTAAEVTNTDYIDTYSAGFEISSTAPAAINANGGTFIFLAIA